MGNCLSCFYLTQGDQVSEESWAGEKQAVWVSPDLSCLMCLRGCLEVKVQSHSTGLQQRVSLGLSFLICKVVGFL